VCTAADLVEIGFRLLIQVLARALMLVNEVPMRTVTTWPHWRQLHVDTGGAGVAARFF